MTSMKIAQFSDPIASCPSMSKIFPLPWPWTSNFKWTPTPPTTLSHKLWNNNCTVHVNKRNQNKNKTKSCRLFPRGNPSLHRSEIYTKKCCRLFSYTVKTYAWNKSLILQGHFLGFHSRILPLKCSKKLVYWSFKGARLVRNI